MGCEDKDEDEFECWDDDKVVMTVTVHLNGNIALTDTHQLFSQFLPEYCSEEHLHS